VIYKSSNDLRSTSQIQFCIYKDERILVIKDINKGLPVVETYSFDIIWVSDDISNVKGCQFINFFDHPLKLKFGFKAEYLHRQT
jgi:hypothetical protein